MYNVQWSYIFLSVFAVVLVFYLVTKYRYENYEDSELEAESEFQKALASNTSNTLKATSSNVRKGCHVETLTNMEDFYSPKSGHTTVLLIYDTRCSHCTEFKKRVWSKMCDLPRNVHLFEIGNETRASQKLRSVLEKKEDIQGYPTVLINNSSTSSRPREYMGPRKVESLRRDILK